METEIVHEIIHDIKKLAQENGIDYLGFTKVSALAKHADYFKNRDLKYKNDFETEFTEKEKLKYQDKYIIVCLFPYITSKTKSILKKRMAEGKTAEGFSIYTISEDYHNVVSLKLNIISEYLKSKGYESESMVDTNPFNERLVAYEAGLGFIGKNGMLINEKLGSFFFIGMIITNLDLSSQVKDRDYIENNIERYCSDCIRCIRACPSKILGKKYIESDKCLSFLTQSKNLNNESTDKFKGRLFGCDTCQIVCPYNDLDKIECSNISEFIPKNEHLLGDLQHLAYLNKEDFKKLKNHAFSWRGKTLLQRNALISMVNKNIEIDFDRINSEKLKEEIKSYKQYTGGENGSNK